MTLSPRAVKRLPNHGLKRNSQQFLNSHRKGHPWDPRITCFSSWNKGMFTFLGVCLWDRVTFKAVCSVTLWDSRSRLGFSFGWASRCLWGRGLGWPWLPQPLQAQHLSGAERLDLLLRIAFSLLISFSRTFEKTMGKNNNPSPGLHREESLWALSL